jgi:hypothetical protein
MARKNGPSLSNPRSVRPSVDDQKVLYFSFESSLCFSVTTSSDISEIVGITFGAEASDLRFIPFPTFEIRVQKLRS